MKKNLNIQNLQKLLTNEPKYRFDQIIKAWINGKYSKFSSITNIPDILKKNLDENINFSTIKNFKIISNDSTYKSIITLYDGMKIETVLMKNLKNKWSICVSSQIGCPVKCAFCATGKMGFKRNLDILEIIEQYIFWNKFISKLPKQANFKNTISNIVYMGMGEPLLNYKNVKSSINLILKFTSIGSNFITVSTIGIINSMNELLNDKDWPDVKIAISLHTLNSEIRKKLIPIHTDSFYLNLKKWCKEYTKFKGARNRFITFEYVMLKGKNDNDKDIKALINFLKGTFRVKINLIPYNKTFKKFDTTSMQNVKNFQNNLIKARITATIRKSIGSDINAACGQLIIK